MSGPQGEDMVKSMSEAAKDEAEAAAKAVEEDEGEEDDPLIRDRRNFTNLKQYSQILLT
jgi:hypothetical protein